jgi:hypothetical protein
MIHESALKGAKKYSKFKIILTDGYTFTSERPEPETLADFTEGSWPGPLDWCVFHKAKINVPVRAVVRIEGIE